MNIIGVILTINIFASIFVIWFLFGIALSIFERYTNYRDLKTKSVLVDEIDTFKWEYIWRCN